MAFSPPVYSVMCVISLTKSQFYFHFIHYPAKSVDITNKIKSDFKLTVCELQRERTTSAVSRACVTFLVIRDQARLQKKYVITLDFFVKYTLFASY